MPMIKPCLYESRARALLRCIVASNLVLLLTMAWAMDVSTSPRANIAIAPAPQGMSLSNAYQVAVREPGGEWQDLSVYNVKIGHQDGNEPLRLSVDPSPYLGPKNASLALFDFNQTVEIRITYIRRDITSFVLSPNSYGLHPQTVGENTIVFTLTQNRESPRKLVFRPNGDWESECLHLLTNPVQSDVPSPLAKNVLAIKPGEEIPRILPEGKDTYYFSPGIHDLPKGLWVDVDFGEPKNIASFDLLTGPKAKFHMPGGIQFRIQARPAGNDTWQVIHEHLGDQNAFDLKNVALKPIKARFVRLILLGNYDPAPRNDGYEYRHSAQIKQFTLYDAEGKNISIGKAVAGAIPNFRCVTDGLGTGSYGHVFGAEAFFIARGDTRIYLAPGAVVRGAIAGEDIANVRLDGRGIIDTSDLCHKPKGGLTSPLRIIKGSRISVEGVTFLDAPDWTVVIDRSQGVRVNQVNIINKELHADGIHFSGSRDAEASGCFIRICDDLFVLYHGGDTRDIAFRHCVLWSDGGRIALFGMGDQGNMSNITVEDCDVLAHQSVWDAKVHGNAFMVWPSAGRTIENVTFKDIRFEAVRYPAISGLFQLKTVQFRHGAPGYLNHVRFENIDYRFPGNLKSYIIAPDNDHPVTDVIFKRVRWGDKLLTTDNANETITMSNVAMPKIE